jgi:hypothetical protein
LKFSKKERENHWIEEKRKEALRIFNFKKRKKEKEIEMEKVAERERKKVEARTRRAEETKRKKGLDKLLNRLKEKASKKRV